MSDPLEQPEMQQPELPPTPKSKKHWLIVGAVVLVLILAGAAFMAGRLMTSRQQSSLNGLTIAGGPGLNGAPAMIQGGSITTGGSGSSINLTPAPELPTLQPDISGVFVKRTDSSFFIGTGMTSVAVMGSSSGQSIDPQVSYDGPSYEIVMTKNTLIYRETTPMTPDTTASFIQQTVAPGSLNDLNTMSMVSVWGKKTGDRYVADVILYSQPVILQSNPGK